MGTALGVDLSIVDKIVKATHAWGGRAELAERMHRCGFDPESEVA
jgi:error-prone DNA polymerase